MSFRALAKTRSRSFPFLVLFVLTLVLLGSLGTSALAQSEETQGESSKSGSDETPAPGPSAAEVQAAAAEERLQEEAAAATAKPPSTAPAPHPPAAPAPHPAAPPTEEPTTQHGSPEEPGAEQTGAEPAAANPGAEGPSSDQEKKAVPPPPKKVPPEVLLLEKAAQIDELLEGTLSIDVEPASLFAVDITDPQSAAIEGSWLRIVVDRATAAAEEKSDAAEADEPTEAAPKNAQPADGDAQAPEVEKAEAEYATLRQTNPKLFEARLALDRARLRFFSLSEAERKKVLDVHSARQKNPEGTVPSQQLSDAQLREKRAQREREKALEAARTARSEAERLIAEERARLLTVAERQAQFDAHLAEREQVLQKIADERLSLRRLVREVLGEARLPIPNTTRVDATYDRLIRELRTTRNSLAGSLAKLNSTRSGVPTAGKNRLEGIPEEMDLREVEATRREVTEGAEKLERKASKFYAEASYVHYTDMEALDDLRLQLVPHLSDAKRNTVTGLGPGGLDQAFSEARHVILVLRYHHSATSRWVSEVTRPTETRGKSALTATLIAIKWVLPIGVFIWWRRRAERSLKWLEDKVREDVQRERTPGKTHPGLHVIELVKRVRRPAEWLLLVWAIAWLLPPEAQGLLEVELTRTVFTWTLGGVIAVTATDFLADLEGPRYRRRSVLLTAHLRLRSLRLVGRAVVVFGLILALTDQLVGKGTIYSWVFNVVWFAALVIFIILVKWWREVIFRRVESKRKKTRFDTWVAANRTGWKSFVAAVSGGTALFVAGGYRALRARVSAFSLTRQLLAYLFQRDMSRQAEVVTKDQFKPLDRERYLLLSPMKHSDELIPSVADAQLDEIIDRINLPGGGVFAIVGERGSGKTTLIKRIADKAEDIIRVPTPFGDMSAFEPVLLKALKKKGPLEDAVREFDEAKRDAGILIDNAHRLIQPMVGGFEGFDRVLSMARTCSNNISWVFAFDEVIWRLLQRMRGTKPLFDDVIRIAPWKEEGIVSLLTSRNEKAGIEPSFEGLMGALPEDADEIDYEEALASTEENYLRLLWHYSSGNPGLAMHAWRMSLGLDDAGQVRVRVFQAPSPALLEGLPDNAHFVLRAIVQLERARLSQICEVTRLPMAAVQDVVRYGKVKGYIHESEDGIGITWTWFRAVTKLLQRRHLLYPAQE